MVHDEFKRQIIVLYNNGKPAGEIPAKNKMAAATLRKWVNDYNRIDSFETKDNRSLEETEF